MKTRMIQLNELQATILLHMIEREMTATRAAKHSSEKGKELALKEFKKMHDAIEKPFKNDEDEDMFNNLNELIEYYTNN